MASSCWFLVFVWIWWLPLVLATAEQQQWGGCSSNRCGNLTVSDPFWLADSEAGRSCGSFDFVVDCFDNSIPILRSSGFSGFAIMDISYEERSLRVVDVQREEDFNDSNGCHFPGWNTSDKLAPPFKVSHANLNLILYNCTKTPAHRDGALVEMRCGKAANAYARAGVRYDESGNYGGYALQGCSATVVPVMSLSGKANASDYKQLIGDGFLMTWDLPPLPMHVPLPTPAPARSKRAGTKILLIGKRNWLMLWKKKTSSTERHYEAMIVSYGSLAPKRYTYSEVMKMTSSRHKRLGQGAYGVVFEGKLHDGCLVAVKFLHDCKGNGEEFVNEVMSIGRTSHVNIVSLFGFCLEGSKRALIYEYMCNGSLDRYIYSENPKEILGWERLYAIAIGIARGLEYLHHSCNTRIVHFDIKPQNILLDKDFCPKIADFGLAKLCRTKESKLSMIGARGTIGFIAPEVHSRNFGLVSSKSDVYSYGMMLLEMVGGRKNVKSVAEKSSEKYFPDWIYDHFAEDDGLEACEVTSDIEEIARKMTLIGLWCIQVLPVYRPTITKVLEMFDRSLDDMAMPPKQNFSGLLENSNHNMNLQSASSTGTEEITPVNSGNTQQFPPL